MDPAQQAAWRSQIDAAADLPALEALRVALFGKKGAITDGLRAVAGLPAEERRAAGAAWNELRDALQAQLQGRYDFLLQAALTAELAASAIDLSLPPRPEPSGSIHPLSRTMESVVAIFGALGFTLYDGPDVEDDFHNFTALNVPPAHPARQMQDTFFLNAEQDGVPLLLRTHTSPVQIRTLRRVGAPLRGIFMGRVYRHDSDRTHTPMFHQLEGLVIEPGIHFGHLRGVLAEFLQRFFQVKELRMRFRPSYFPFTEPSVEVDINCRRDGAQLILGEGDDWLEVLGAGMVHPTVLAHGGLDPATQQGFAFGAGLDRLTMLKYGISDLRSFFAGDLRWLRHYGLAAHLPVSLAEGEL